MMGIELINTPFTVTTQGKQRLNNHGSQDQGRQCGAEHPRPALICNATLMPYGSVTPVFSSSPRTLPDIPNQV